MKSGSSGPRAYAKQGLRRRINGVWVWRTIQTFNVRVVPPCALAVGCCSSPCHHHYHHHHPRRRQLALVLLSDQSPLLSHSHRHWPPCLPQSLPPPFPCRNKPLQAQKQPCRSGKLRSSRLPKATSRTNSSGLTPRSRTLLGDRRLSRRTQRYISPEKKKEEEGDRRQQTYADIQLNSRSLHSFTGSQALRP